MTRNFDDFLPKSHDEISQRIWYLEIQTYEYCSTYHDFIAKAISGVGYLHLGSILLNCTNIDISIGLHLHNEILIDRNVNWYILSEKRIQSSIICFPKKIFAFVQLLHECEYFFDIELFCSQFQFIWWKMVLCIFRIQLWHFWVNITGFIHICAVRELTTQIEISYHQIIFITFMWVFWQV